MIYTNKQGISQEFVEALTERQKKYRHEGDYSVTEILNSPRQAQLLRRHHEECEMDVSDLYASWVGHLIHDAIEMDLPRANMEILGSMLSGVCDYWEDGILKDYKTTTAWSIIDESSKKKWEQQTNIYAYLYEEVYGWKTDKIFIEIFVTDWQRGRALQGGNYPQQRQFQCELSLWDKDTTRAFIEERLSRHIDSERLGDNDLPLCSAEEMWAVPDKWAVKKGKNKRAVRVLESMEDARNYVEFRYTNEKAEEENIWIEHRPGERIKCERYCSQGKFCNQKIL